MLFFHSYRKEGFVLDLIGDIRRINMMAMKAKHTGAIIIGGGVVKHHIMNANLMRNGCDECVLINTGLAQPYTQILHGFLSVLFLLESRVPNFRVRENSNRQ